VSAAGSRTPRAGEAAFKADEPGPVRASLAGRRFAVCVGPGGVGKTTVAAGIGLGAALDGARVLVCTIDPARRLANALGLSSLGNVESRVPDHKFAEAGLRPKGALFAMMLDVKRTWDDLVTRHAPDSARRERILRNRLYQQMSAALAGSQEYMAMEKLYELATDRDYDVVVLDTPPTAHALDFLDAPDRILDFLGNDTARAMLAPAAAAGKFGLRLAQLGGGYIAKTLARFTGQAVLSDLGDFLQSFQGMYEGFKERAAEVRALLARPTVGFVLVTSPSPVAIDEVLALHERLHAESMPIAGFVANRVTPDLWPGGPLPDARALARALGGANRDLALAGRLATTLAEHQALAAAERRALDRLFRAIDAPSVVVPRLEVDVHDLAGLARLCERL
jgi:anion-transporting  ArsA/GET3 family ATPase